MKLSKNRDLTLRGRGLPPPHPVGVRQVLWYSAFLLLTVVILALATFAPLPFRHTLAALTPLLIVAPVAGYVGHLAWRIFVRSRPLSMGVRSLNPKHLSFDPGYVRGLSITWNHGPHQLRLTWDEVPRPGGCCMIEVCLDTSALLPEPFWFEAATRFWEPSDRLMPERQWEETFEADEEGPSGPLEVAASSPGAARRLADRRLIELMRRLEGSLGFPGAYVGLTPTLASVRKICRLPDSPAVEAFVRLAGQMFSRLLEGVGIPPLLDFTSFKIPNRKG